jgi:SAM-dependent methyltransferase
VHRRLIDATGVGVGMKVLDVGCGTGDLLAAITERGANVTGVDPAIGMVERSRQTAPAADVRRASWDDLPWSGPTFDVVFALNSLQFADDTLSAIAGASRLIRDGGLLAVANWAERELNDLDRIDAALAAEDGDEPAPDGDLRREGGLEAVLDEAGLDVVTAGTVGAAWEAVDEPALLRAVLLDDDASADVSSYRASVLNAARPFRREDGRYVLGTTYRYAIGRVRVGCNEPERDDAERDGAERDDAGPHDRGRGTERYDEERGDS